MRLDAFLASQIAGWSRAIATSDRSRRRARQRQTQQAFLQTPRTRRTRSRTGRPAAASFTPEAIPIEIVYEDETLVVVNKPAGSWSIPPRAYIRAHSQRPCTSLSTTSNASSVRPGIVHRLTAKHRAVVAKTEAALEHLSEQFRARWIYKSYIALVHGRVQTDSGRIDQPLARDPSNRTRMAVVRGGRSALSRYRVNRRFHRFTLLDVELKTAGRTRSRASPGSNIQSSATRRTAAVATT